MSSTLLISVAAAVVGFAAYWSNPRRAVNRAFFGASLHVALWLACLDQAMKGGPDGQFWMRTTSVVGAFIVVSLWVVKETIVVGESGNIKISKGEGFGFLLCAAFLAALVPTDWYVSPFIVGGAPEYLWGYKLFMAGLLVLYVALFTIATRQMRQAVGVSKLELQVVLLGGSISALAVLGMMVLRSVLGAPNMVRLQPVAILLFYVFSGFFITTGKVFSTKQLVKILFRRIATLSLVFSIALAFFFAALQSFGPLPSVTGSVAAALLMNRALKLLTHKAPKTDARALNVRNSVVLAGQHERSMDGLRASFSKILSEWGDSETALVLAIEESANPAFYHGAKLTSDIAVAMSKMRWVTPERLQRERETAENIILSKFLGENDLGVLIYGEGFAVKVITGVGVRISGRPYTFPQVAELMDIVPLIQSALERAYFSEKLRHADQLATVGLLGASLAHEIRNPLVSIKAFSQLLPLHYQDQEFRSKFSRIICEEVIRIEELTDQLLDLAAPKALVEEQVDLHPLLISAVELLALKAVDKEIEIRTDLVAEKSKLVTDPAAVRQVILNLCLNSIQALDSYNQSQKWVCVSTRNVGENLEITVSDSGPGISAEMLPRIFEPFHSTKSSGFGLGLAVCRDILLRLKASIAVDSPRHGEGATFRVTFRA